jgi:formiminotetrahydrofolate cyclodeaminase
MRFAIAIPAVLALAACQVSKDNANGTTSVTYNSDVAENAAADVGNTAQNIASDIGNDVQNTGEKIQNKVDNTDVNIKVGKDEHTNTSTTTTTTENKSK